MRTWVLVAGLLLSSAASAVPFVATDRGQVATLLMDGRVLVTGGETLSSPVSSAVLYDPLTASFAPSVAPMLRARTDHTATTLRNGNVLVVGGRGSSGELVDAELFDPRVDAWAATGALAAARFGHTTTLLRDGRVLVVGGVAAGAVLSSAELYDPVSGRWSSLPALQDPRVLHTATLLPDGTVLVAGGSRQASSLSMLATAQRFDPATRTWSASIPLLGLLAGHSATVTTTGRVVFSGGFNVLGQPTGVAHALVISTQLPQALSSLYVSRTLHTALVNEDGLVSLYAGATGSGQTASHEAFSGSAWQVVGSLPGPRAGHAAVRLPAGDVFFAGGTASAWSARYVEHLWQFSSAGPLSQRADHTVTALPDGRVLLFGGRPDASSLPVLQLYTPGVGLSAPSVAAVANRDAHSATVLAGTSTVLLAGGRNGLALTTSELFDWKADLLSPGPGLNQARAEHTATVLADGTVLVSGGTGLLPLSSAELLASGTFTVVGAMGSSRAGHTATLLPDGQVLLVGGRSLLGRLASAELYDPVTRTFRSTGVLSTAREGHTATLLPSGSVLVTGGWSVLSSTLSSCELYEPATGTFRAVAALPDGRARHVASLLPSGRVLVTGGNNTSSGVVFEPATESWRNDGTLFGVRSKHGAALLATGELFVLGGEGSGSAQPQLGRDDRNRGTVAPVRATWVRGGTATLSGFSFVAPSEGHGGSSRTGATNLPVMTLQHVESGRLFALPVDSVEDASATVRIPEDAPLGHAWARVFHHGGQVLAVAVEVVATVPALVDRLRFVSTPRTFVAGGCSAELELVAGDASGALPVSAEVVASLSFAGHAASTFWGDPGCATTPLTAAKIPAGQSFVRIHVKDTQTGAALLSAAAAGLQPAEQTLTVTAAAPHHVRMQSASSVTASMALVPAFQVEDAFNNPVGPATFTVTASLDGHFAPPTGPHVMETRSVTSDTDGASTLPVHFHRAGTATLTATLGTESRSVNLDVLPGPAVFLRLLASPNPAQVNAPISLKVKVEDADYNRSPTPVDVTLHQAGAGCALGASTVRTDVKGEAFATLTCAEGGEVTVCARSAPLPEDCRTVKVETPLQLMGPSTISFVATLLDGPVVPGAEVRVPVSLENTSLRATEAKLVRLEEQGLSFVGVEENGAPMAGVDGSVALGELGPGAKRSLVLRLRFTGSLAPTSVWQVHALDGTPLSVSRVVTVTAEVARVATGCSCGQPGSASLALWVLGLCALRAGRSRRRR